MWRRDKGESLYSFLCFDTKYLSPVFPMWTEVWEGVGVGSTKVRASFEVDERWPCLLLQAWTSVEMINFSKR